MKTQWADAAARVSIRLDPAFSNRHAAPARQYHGVAVTYAQVAVKASVHQRLTMDARTLVILDEVHHGGDALSWGDAIREAFEPATRRLCLTGTPFRSDTAPIPFVEYHLDEARPDYVLVLPWNLREEISAQLGHVGDWGGRLVFAIPKLDVVEPTKGTLR